jgi:hypothetical protein
VTTKLKHIRAVLQSSTVLTTPLPGRWYFHVWLREMGAELFRRHQAKEMTAAWMEKFVPFYNNLSRSCGLAGLLNTMIVRDPDGGWKLPSL